MLFHKKFKNTFFYTYTLQTIIVYKIYYYYKDKKIWKSYITNTAGIYNYINIEVRN